MCPPRTILSIVAAILALGVVCTCAGHVSAWNPVTGDPVFVTNKNLSTSISIVLTSDKDSLQAGDEINLIVGADRNCHLSVMHLSMTGKVTVLWPSAETGWDDTVAAGRAVKVTGEGTGLRIRPDGHHPYESFAVVAASERNSLLRSGDFREAAAGRLKVFSGDVTELARVLADRVKQLPPHVQWGIAEARLSVSTGHSVGAQPAAPQQTWPVNIPFALRSSDGKYLSMRDGEVGFFAREIGPTEVFRFSPVANDQFKIVGYNGAALTRSGPPGESVERKQAFDPWLMKEKTATTHHVAFRGSDGKYMAVGDDGRRVVFDACFPSLRPDKHKGLFILVPVRGQGTADELPESDDSGLGLKVHEFSHSMEHFRE